MAGRDSLIDALGESMALRLVSALRAQRFHTDEDVARAIELEARRLVQAALPYAPAERLEKAIAANVRPGDRGMEVDFAAILRDLLDPQQPLPGVE